MLNHYILFSYSKLIYSAIQNLYIQIFIIGIFGYSKLIYSEIHNGHNMNVYILNQNNYINFIIQLSRIDIFRAITFSNIFRINMAYVDIQTYR